MTSVENIKYLEQFFGLTGEELIWKLAELNHGLVINGEMVELIELR